MTSVDNTADLLQDIEDNVGSEDLVFESLKNAFDRLNFPTNLIE